MLLCCFSCILAWISCEDYWVYQIYRRIHTISVKRAKVVHFLKDLLSDLFLFDFVLFHVICFIQCVSVAKNPPPPMYFSLYIHSPGQAIRLNHCVVSSSIVTLSFSSLSSLSSLVCVCAQHWGSLYLLDTEGPLWWERCSSVCCRVSVVWFIMYLDEHFTCLFCI